MQFDMDPCQKCRRAHGGKVVVGGDVDLMEGEVVVGHITFEKSHYFVHSNVFLLHECLRALDNHAFAEGVTGSRR